jgi:hypothetical protein
MGIAASTLSASYLFGVVGICVGRVFSACSATISSLVILFFVRATEEEDLMGSYHGPGHMSRA